MGIVDKVRKAVEVSSDELDKALKMAESSANAKLDSWLSDHDNGALSEAYRLAKEQVELRRDLLRQQLKKELAAKQEAERKERERKEQRFETLCAALTPGAFMARLEGENKEAVRIYLGLQRLDTAIAARMQEHLALQAESYELARALGKPTPAPVFQRREDVMSMVREAVGTFLRLNPDVPGDVIYWIAGTR